MKVRFSHLSRSERCKSECWRQMKLSHDEMARILVNVAASSHFVALTNLEPLTPQAFIAPEDLITSSSLPPLLQSRRTQTSLERRLFAA
jgi:hypothetical protein